MMIPSSNSWNLKERECLHLCNHYKWIKCTIDVFFGLITLFGVDFIPFLFFLASIVPISRVVLTLEKLIRTLLQWFTTNLLNRLNDLVWLTFKLMTDRAFVTLKPRFFIDLHVHWLSRVWSTPICCCCHRLMAYLDNPQKHIQTTSVMCFCQI